MRLKQELLHLVNDYQIGQGLIDRFVNSIFKEVRTDCCAKARLGERSHRFELSFEGSKGGNSHLCPSVSDQLHSKLKNEGVDVTFQLINGEHKFIVSW